MDLPLTPPVQPMLATAVDAVPRSAGLRFEPKWDGYRCLVFRDGDEVLLQSRSGKPLTRYFPEVLAALRAALPPRIVLDGELVVVSDGRLDFDALAERVHPADTRIRELAEARPASYVAFDLLALEDVAVLELGFGQRRAALEQVLGAGTDLVHLNPVTADRETALRWFTLFEGAGLDGLVVKSASAPYQPGRRTMVKVKHARTADCVVGGLRWHAGTERGTSVGSLLLGLYDDHGVLHHVGVVGAFTAARRRELVGGLAPYLPAAGEEHPWLGDAAADGRRVPGNENRWRAGEQPWEPLRPELVVEVGYEHTEGAAPARFRHNAQFHRWRPDREPASCRYDQLEQPVRFDLDAVLRGDVTPAGP